MSGGSSDAKLAFTSPFGNQTSTFEIVNDGTARCALSAPNVDGKYGLSSNVMALITSGCG